MSLDTLPAEILWEIYDHLQLAIPVGYHGFYEDNSPDQALKALRTKNGINFSHVCSRLYYALAPRIWVDTTVSTNPVPLWNLERPDLATHVTNLEIVLHEHSDVYRIVESTNLPNLAHLKINCGTHFPSSEMQKYWGSALGHFQTHVVIDLMNVPAMRLHELEDTRFLGHVQTLTFAISPQTNRFSDCLDSSVGNMPALRRLKSNAVNDHYERHCYRPIANLDVIKVVEKLPLLEELDLSGLSSAVGKLRIPTRNWLPHHLTMLKCDWNVLHVMLATNDSFIFEKVKHLTIVMTRQFRKLIPDLRPFVNMESLDLLRGPSPWPQSTLVQMFMHISTSNIQLADLHLEGISSTEISTIAPMFTGIRHVTVDQIPEDSFGLGIHFSDRVLNNLQAPANQILISASASLKILNIHITKKSNSISYPLLESLVIESTRDSLPLTHIIVYFEQTKLYERKFANPIEKIFTGFSSNKFSIHGFCSPLRSVASLNLEASCSLVQRRELFGAKRNDWDPIVIDIAKLRTLLLIPPKGSRIHSRPLTSDLLWSNPIVSC